MYKTVYKISNEIRQLVTYIATKHTQSLYVTRTKTYHIPLHKLQQNVQVLVHNRR